jgi:hypothetical protein
MLHSSSRGKAARLFARAAELGYAAAQHDLAQMMCGVDSVTVFFVVTLCACITDTA